MTKSFISSASAESTSIAMPSHQVGDTLVMWAYRSISTTRVVAPTGWFYRTMRTNVAQSATMCWKIATSGSETSGTWANAEGLIAAVYRDDLNYLVLGGCNPVSGAATTNIQYLVIAAASTQATGLNTMASDSAWVIGAVGGVSIISDIQTAPSGMTNRISLLGGAFEMALHDTNGDVANWPTTSHTADIATAYQSAVAELVDSGIVKSSAAASFGYILGS